MIPNPHKTSFIIFEGIDHSGKSTKFELLQQFLAVHYPQHPVVYTKEPGSDRETGREIYAILRGQHPKYKLEEMSRSSMQSFYIGDRMPNYRYNIIPALQAGKHVLQDRGLPSSFAFGSEDEREFCDFMIMHDRIFSAALVPLFWPDLIVIFDVPAGVAIKRAQQAGIKADAFEQLSVLERARRNYLAFAKKYPNCIVVDGTKEEQEIFTEVKSKVLPLLGIKE